MPNDWRPDHLRILGQRTPVRWLHERTHGLASKVNLSGQFRSGLGIDVSLDIYLDQQKESLVHEACHALLHTTGQSIEDKEADEKQVQGLAAALLQFLRENTAVVAWLQERDDGLTRCTHSPAHTDPWACRDYTVPEG